MDESVNLPLVAIRALHFGASMELVGLFAVPLFVTAPAMASCPVKLACHRRLVTWSWYLGFLSWVGWLWCTLAVMSEAPLWVIPRAETFRLALIETHFGQFWMLRFGIWVLLGLFLLLCRKGGNETRWLFLRNLSGLAIAGILLASLAWVGHAVAMSGMETAGTVHLAADAMHLLAAGFWPAGLHPFLLFLASVRRDFRESHEPHLFDIAAVATRRFSAMSLAIVPAVALTGITNSVYLVGSFAALTGTPYGRILLLKLSLFSGMICLGGWNLLFLKPRLLPIPQNPHRIKLRERSLDALRKSVVAELCLGAAVIIVVGVLGITEPAMH